MKILLNTTTRPVGFDYARALHAAGNLSLLVSGFPRRQSVNLASELRDAVTFADFWQMVFLVANRLGGSTNFSRALSHKAKIALDRATARRLEGCDAAVFYSGAGLVTSRACRQHGILSVCQVHHAHVSEQESILRSEARQCGLPYTPIYSDAQVRRQLQEFDEADVILCPSNTVRESFVRAGMSGERLLVVPHGVDLQQKFNIERQVKTQNPGLRVLYVGQLHYRKGLRYLTEALGGLSSSDVELRLVGPDFGLSGLCAASVPSAEPVKTGAKKGAEIAREYADADVFVLPSLEEGFGLVVLEAMCAGLPVIITSAVGAKDFVTDGVEGWIVPPKNPAALRAKVEWMKSHPEDRRKMGLAAKAKAQAAGGWSESARRLVEALEGKRAELGPKHPAFKNSQHI